MKIKYLLILTALFFITSCDVNEIEEENLDTLIIEEGSKLDNNRTALSSLTLSNTDSDSKALENKMQWLSFMTAQVLIRDVKAREQFRYLANKTSSTNIIKLKNLIYSPDTSFKNALRDEFLLNYHGHLPCEEIGRPRGRPQPVGNPGESTNENDENDDDDDDDEGITGGNGGLIDNNGGRSLIFDKDSSFSDTLLSHNDLIIYDNYLNSLLENDCLEFYLPNGFFDTNLILSTAHPLNLDNFNDGYQHPNSNSSTSACFVSSIDIDDSLVNNSIFNYPIIVVRPFSSLITCSYDEYRSNGIDFKNFLSNNNTR